MKVPNPVPDTLKELSKNCFILNGGWLIHFIHEEILLFVAAQFP